MKKLNTNEKKRLRELKRLRSLLQNGDLAGDLTAVQNEILMLRGEVSAEVIKEDRKRMVRKEYVIVTESLSEKYFNEYLTARLQGFQKSKLALKTEVSRATYFNLIKKWESDPKKKIKIDEVEKEIENSLKNFRKYKKFRKLNMTFQELAFSLDVTEMELERHFKIWENNGRRIDP